MMDSVSAVSSSILPPPNRPTPATSLPTALIRICATFLTPFDLAALRETNRFFRRQVEKYSKTRTAWEEFQKTLKSEERSFSPHIDKHYSKGTIFLHITPLLGEHFSQLVSHLPASADALAAFLDFFVIDRFSTSTLNLLFPLLQQLKKPTLQPPPKAIGEFCTFLNSYSQSGYLRERGCDHPWKGYRIFEALLPLAPQEVNEARAVYLAKEAEGGVRVREGTESRWIFVSFWFGTESSPYALFQDPVKRAAKGRYVPPLHTKIPKPLEEAIYQRIVVLGGRKVLFDSIPVKKRSKYIEYLTPLHTRLKQIEPLKIDYLLKNGNRASEKTPMQEFVKQTAKSVIFSVFRTTKYCLAVRGLSHVLPQDTPLLPLAVEYAKWIEKIEPRLTVGIVGISLLLELYLLKSSEPARENGP